MAILALDLGQNCGWAISFITSGTWNLKPTRFESAGQRFVKFRNELAMMHANFGITEIVYEEVRAHMGVDAAHAYGGYLAILQEFALGHGISYRGVPVATIKKYATGKGSAKKEQMVAAAIQKFKDVNVASDDHADALWILDYALSQNDFEIV